MQEKFEEHAEFLTIYIREAHPEDEWQMTSNEEEDVCYAQPKTIGQRVGIANDFIERFDFQIDLLVDPIENPADDIYAGWPERLYVIDVDGTIAYKGATGPFGFEPDEVEAWLADRFQGELEKSPSEEALRHLDESKRLAAAG